MDADRIGVVVLVITLTACILTVAEELLRVL